MTFEQILRFIEAREAGKRSATQLLLPHATHTIVGSSYKRQKRDAAEQSSSKHEDPCSYCGKRGHGRNAHAWLRRKECSAYGTTYNHYNKSHHFESVCRGKAKTKSSRTSEQEDVIFDILCELITKRNMASISLDHHIYDKLTKKWFRHPLKSQPVVRLCMEIQKVDWKFWISSICPAKCCFSWCHGSCKAPELLGRI